MTQEINKQLHEALGLKPNLHPMSLTYYPDYCADPRLVIEAMMEREDFNLFIGAVWLHINWETNEKTHLMPVSFIDLIMDKTGKLALLALEWIRKEK